MLINKIKKSVLLVFFVLSACAGPIFDPNYVRPKLIRTATSVTLSEKKLELLIGEKAQILAQVELDNGKITNRAAWKSSNPEIAKVSTKGEIYALSLGAVDITATSRVDNNLSAIIKITVLENPNKKTHVDPNTPTKPVNPVKDNITNIPAEKKAVLQGNVYDLSWDPVPGATVTAKAIENNTLNWETETQKTNVEGFYYFNVPIATKVEITVNKDGWTSSTRTTVIKPEIDDEVVNIVKFGGPRPENNLFGIQDQPVITDVLFNNAKVPGPGPEITNFVAATPPGIDDSAGISIVNSETPEIKIIFSEPVKKEDVEKSFQIISQNFASQGDKSFLIDKDTPGVSFTWEEKDNKVTIKLNKPFTLNDIKEEAKYRLQFVSTFHDLRKVAGVKGKYIRFAPDLTTDYVVFSVKDPSLQDSQNIQKLKNLKGLNK
jgi:hypothetical protein